jgi:hypothetical protein
MNPTIKRSVVVLAAALFLGGCEEILEVRNPVSGDTDRVLATPLDAENLLGTYWKRWHSGLYGGTGSLDGIAANFGLYSYSSLANNCMNSHLPFTDATNFNHAGNICGGEQSRNFTFNSEVNKVAAIFLKKLEIENFNLGTPSRNLRARAFANFLVGLSVGSMAIVHDSMAMAGATTGASEATPFIHYTAARDSMVLYFQKAIDLANDPIANGTDGFPLPGTWIPTSMTGGMTNTNFIQLVRSHRARLLAQMGRSPAERATADWAMIQADAAAGVTADWYVTTSTTTGPTHAGWRNQFTVYGLWHQMPPWYIGMADTSGSYAAWTALPVGDRGAGNQGLTLATPDLRFPQGATRAAQQSDFSITGCQTNTGPTCPRYFVNRASGLDQFTGNGYGFSNYDHVRHHQWRTSGVGAAATARNGNTIDIPASEMRLLQAEALYRAGDYPGAAALINVSRTAAGLPNAPGDAVSLVPGAGNSCVPKVPKGPAFNTIGCGTLWDALIYENMIETVYMSYLSGFFLARGFGMLPEGTPTYWATPYQEIQARGLPASQIYGTGIGNIAGSTAGLSIYGWNY